MFTKQGQGTYAAHPRQLCQVCQFERKCSLGILGLTVPLAFWLNLWYFGSRVGVNWWYTVPSFLGICWLLWVTRRIHILILTSYCRFNAQLFETISFYRLTRRPALAQWYWRHEKLPLGPIRRRKKQLDAGWIVMRLAPWPDRFPWHGHEWLNWCILRRQDWKRCALGLYLYENMAASKSPAPIECSVDGLETAALRKKDENLLFVELSSARYHWSLRDARGQISLLWQAGGDRQR